MKLTKSLNDQLMIMAAHRYCLRADLRHVDNVSIKEMLSNLAVAAHNYCLGRQTYIVGACIEWLLANWSKLTFAA
jgi:hypothetical protein